MGGQGRTVAAVALGGALGALARWGIGLAVPTVPGAFPWTTWAINVAGGLLMGVLIVVVTEVRPAHPLVRPLLGTGVLGGFTTFSTYAVEGAHLIGGDHPVVAVLYLGGTALAVVAAVALGTAATRRLARHDAG